MRVLCSIALLLFSLSGCAMQQNSTVSDASGGAYPLPLPVVYSAEAPCQNCSGKRLFLTLFPENLYLLRLETTLKDTDVTRVKAEFGLWHFDVKRRAVTLSSYENSTRTLVITSAKTLAVQTASSGQVPLGVQTELIVTPGGNSSFDYTLPMQGYYSRANGEVKFTECLTKKTFLMMRDGAYSAIEQVYTSHPHAQEEPLLVSIEGRFTTPVDEDGLEDDTAVFPERLVDIRPDIDCTGAATHTIPLVGSTWYLLELEGHPLQLANTQKRPFLHLTEQGKKVKGFGGCNDFAGTYFRLGDVFLFNKRIGQRMACVDGMELEFDFFRILSATDGYRLDGNILEFRDRKRNVLARFEYGKGL